MKKQRCIIFGATGKLGKQLLRYLLEDDRDVLAVGRNLKKIKNFNCKKYILDFNHNNKHLPFNLEKEDIVINAAHSCYTEKILSLCQARYHKFILVGSTRKYSKLNNPEDNSVRKSVQLIKQTNHNYVILHPTMIYGSSGENNVQRVVKLAKFLRVVPLPIGLRARIQPIYIEDVVLSIIKAIDNNLTNVEIDLGGPKPMTYKQFLEEIFQCANLKGYIIPVPDKMLYMLSAFSRGFEKVPSVTKGEIKRLYEDKAIDISHMKKKLGIRPRSFSKGLREMFDNQKR